MLIRFDNNGTQFETKQYLVQILDTDDGLCCASMKTASEIIDWLGMSDCYPEMKIKVYDVETQFGSIEELEVHETWHNMSDPLYIKVTHSDGTVEFDGYGTDH